MNILTIIITILGLIGTILGLILQTKKIKRENYLEKKRLQDKINQSNNEKKSLKELNTLIIQVVDDYIKNELPNLIEKKINTEKKIIENVRSELKSFLLRELSERMNTDETLNSKKKIKKNIEKTMAEAYGININNLRDGFGFVDKSLYKK